MPKEEFSVTALDPVLAFALLGFISGSLSMYFGYDYSSGDSSLAVYIGNLQAPFFFSIAMIYGLVKWRRTSDTALPRFMLFTSLGWLVANATVVLLPEKLNHSDKLGSGEALFIAGFLGTLITIFALRSILDDVRSAAALWVPVAIGAVIGPVPLLELTRTPYIVFVAWQVAIGASIGYFYVKKAPKAAPKKKKAR